MLGHTLSSNVGKVYVRLEAQSHVNESSTSCVTSQHFKQAVSTSIQGLEYYGATNFHENSTVWLEIQHLLRSNSNKTPNLMIFSKQSNEIAASNEDTEEMLFRVSTDSLNFSQTRRCKIPMDNWCRLIQQDVSVDPVSVSESNTDLIFLCRTAF